MSERIYIYGASETGRRHPIGWFSPSAARCYREEKDFDGRNLISRNTGGQWSSEALWHTAGGRWVLEERSGWAGAPSRYSYVGEQTAIRWLSHNDYDDEVRRLTGRDVPAEKDPEGGNDA